VLKLLGHASIQTTGGIYAGWDADELAAILTDVLADEMPAFPLAC
jgi:integrase